MMILHMLKNKSINTKINNFCLICYLDICLFKICMPVFLFLFSLASVDWGGRSRKGSSQYGNLPPINPAIIQMATTTLMLFNKMKAILFPHPT